MRFPRDLVWFATLLATPFAMGAQNASVPSEAPREIRLWPGKAPGTENWTLPETVTTSPNGDRTVSNVSDPTLTVFLPDPATATGAAVVLAPGGALRVLGIDGNGTHIARWLNAKGIAAFVLKYRTRQQDGGGMPMGPRGGGPGGPRQELDIHNANANPAPDDAALTEVLQMAVADAQEAFKLIRGNAVQWKVDPTRVGIMASRPVAAWPLARPWRRNPMPIRTS